MKTMTLTLDDLDYAAIQREIAHRQARSRAIGADRTILPKGRSSLAGSILAECCRDLDEYRALWEAEHPRDGATNP